MEKLIFYFRKEDITYWINFIMKCEPKKIIIEFENEYRIKVIAYFLKGTLPKE